MKVSNPILKGFYPDPSICRVGDDFYLANSSFAYFPGVPIFHSKDLAHWEQIGHVLDRKEQLPLNNVKHSNGIFAPTIRYHEGTFYMITTNVSAGGNFLVTAKDPSGPWSNPYYLGDEATGIDPSLFFDEDGSCYYVGTRPNPKGVTYNGDWEIWVQELDLHTMKLTGESSYLWKGALKEVIWPEGPHLYKKDDYYYLMIAEGGTGPNHSITIARSKNLRGPYENNPNNPILTHWHLGKKYPIVYVGHGDLVDDKQGNWYVIMLASRRCEGYTNLGRETFLAKVVWEDGWPIVNEGVGKLEDVVDIELPSCEVLKRKHCYHFYTKELEQSFVCLRNPKESMYEILEKEGVLRLFLQPETLTELASPTYLGVRQEEYDYMVSTHVAFVPQQVQEEAGIAIVQSNLYHMRFVLKSKDDAVYLCLISVQDGKDVILKEEKISAKQVELEIINHGQKADFIYKENGNRVLFLKEVDMRSLSTEVAGGFTGCTIGMYASSNGKESQTYADFHWFSYENI